MNRPTSMFLAALIGFGLSAPAWAQDSTSFSDEPWHFTYAIGGANWDNSRESTDGDVWNVFGFGYFLNDRFSLDLEWDEFQGTLDNSVVQAAVPGATDRRWTLRTWSLMGRYYLTEGNWRPYLLGGLGNTKHTNVIDQDSNMSLNLGVGVQGKLARHWSTRAQLLYRTDKDGDTIPSHSSFDDIYFSVGLNFDFGGTEPPPPPPPPPPPAPPPKPENPDLDGDGVPNERDKCPNTRPGAVVDLDGCEVEAVIELQGVHFDFDKSTLRPEAKVILNQAASLLEQHERVVVEVAGHTDSVGSDQYNQGLSERRANAVRDYLVEQGIRASRLTAVGHGESRPVATNDTAEGRQENRRVELVVLDR